MKSLTYHLDLDSEKEFHVIKEENKVFSSKNKEDISNFLANLFILHCDEKPDVELIILYFSRRKGVKKTFREIINIMKTKLNEHYKKI